MKKSKILTLILITGIILTGCGQKLVPTLEDGKQVVATLDGKNITAEELYEEMKIQGGTSTLVNLIDKFIAEKEITDEEEAMKYADAQIENLKAQYESYGESFTDALTNAGYKTEDDFKKVIILDYKKNKVAENHIKESFTDKEVNDHYKNNITGEMTVRYILVKPEITDSMSDSEKEAEETKALNEAKEVIAKLKDGEKFEDLAKTHSDDATTASEGGLFSNFIKTDVVEEFWNASIALKDGKYTTTPVKSSYGYFVILRIKQNERPKLEDVKDDILEALYSKKAAEDENVVSKAWTEVRKKYNLEIIDSKINDDYLKTTKSIK